MMGPRSSRNVRDANEMLRAEKPRRLLTCLKRSGDQIAVGKFWEKRLLQHEDGPCRQIRRRGEGTL